MSLDSTDDAVFRAMNDVNFPVARVVEGIDAAAAAGLAPIKIDAVVKRGLNDHTVVDLARFIRERGHILRFIEYMDVGTTNGWRLDDVVPGAEIIEMIDREMPLEPIEANYRGEVAKRWRYRDGSGEVGVIASVTQPFCGDCACAAVSGTHAAVTQRSNLIRRLLKDTREAMRTSATNHSLEAMLQTGHFSSSHDFTFGARPRDYGWMPKTRADRQDLVCRGALVAERASTGRRRRWRKGSSHFGDPTLKNCGWVAGWLAEQNC